MPSTRLYTVDPSTGKPVYLDIDGQTHAPVIITNEHHHIHEGWAWSITSGATLNAADVYRYLIVTPNSDWLVHFRHSIFGEGEGTFQIYEAPTYSNAGTSVTPVNRNRANVNNPKAVVTHTPTTSALGTLLFTGAFGAAKTDGSNAATEEWVFARNKAYLIVITSDVASNEINWEIFWYEHSRYEDSYA